MLPEAEDQNNDDNILDSFELDRDQITVVRLLGTGNFGQVSKANYGRLVVAVKSLKGIAFILLFIAFFQCINTILETVKGFQILVIGVRSHSYRVIFAYNI